MGNGKAAGKRNAPENLNIMRKAVINLIRNNGENRKKAQSQKCLRHR
jgi:sRNA-binding carbon storage regulator CsrA